jgi:hypothetical protein
MFWEISLGLLLPFASLAPASTHALITTAAPMASAPAVDSAAVEAYGPQRLPFTVRFGDAENDYRVMAMFVLPDQAVPVGVVNPSGAYDLTATAGSAQAGGASLWRWVAPTQPGLYPIEIRERSSGRSMTLNVFVMVPFSELRGGSIHGYPIGHYPAPRSEFYERPRGFVEVTPELNQVAVSPHFTLGQFVCKQAGGPPEYLVLRQPLLAKLEQVLAEVNERGHEVHSFSLLSAYRTPRYNAAIGNVTTFSRHHYGDAADIFVDEDGDGRMDDLNGDGRHDLADARWLGGVVDHVAGESPAFIGGLGTYEPTSEHGAFVHVDVRGFEARWGA